MEVRERLRAVMSAWLSTFVREFRSQLEKLPEDKQKLVLRGNDFRAPCQILMFWILEPQYQYVIVVRDPRIPYNLIKIYGPATLATMASEADTMLKDRWFDGVPRLIDPSVEQQYKKILEEHLLGLIRTLPNAATWLPASAKNEIQVVKRAGEELTYFTWSIFGNLLGQHPLEFAVKAVANPVIGYEKVETREENQESVKAATTSPNPQPTRPGFLSALYPPIWLGEPLTFEFRDRVDGIYITPSSRKFRCVYKERELTIMQNGVLTMIEPERATCLGLLNEIMCTALLLGFPSSAIRDEDLSEALFYDNGELGSCSLGVSERRRQSIEEEFSAISEEEFETFRQLSEADLKKVIETAEGSTKDPQQSDYAKWFIDAYSYWEEANHDHSIMKTWLIFEKHAWALWDGYAKESLRRGNNRSTQGKPPMKKLLEDLFRGNRIAEAEYRKLDRLRDQRNKIMHEGRAATREEAEAFLALGEDLTRRKMGISKEISQNQNRWFAILRDSTKKERGR